jgi:hypothetical protein
MKLWEHQLQMRSLQMAYLEIFRDFPEDIIINENKLGIFGEVNLEFGIRIQTTLGSFFCGDLLHNTNGKLVEKCKQLEAVS